MGKRGFREVLAASLHGMLSSKEFRGHPKENPTLGRCGKLLGEV